MKNTCVDCEGDSNLDQAKHFLIWAGVWLAALLALFPR